MWRAAFESVRKNSSVCQWLCACVCGFVVVVVCCDCALWLCAVDVFVTVSL